MTAGTEPIPALRGAFTVLSRLPIPGSERDDWYAMCRSPWTFPVVGAVIGGTAGVALAAPIPTWSAVAAYLLAIYLLDRTTHGSGIAALPAGRNEGSWTGLSIVLPIVVAFGALGALSTVTQPSGPFRLALAAEVGAKLGMGLLCLGTPPREAEPQLAGSAGPVGVVLAALLALPILAGVHSGLLPTLAGALLAGPIVAIWTLVRSRDAGIGNSQFGLVNDAGRALGIHLGVALWWI